MSLASNNGSDPAAPRGVGRDRDDGPRGYVGIGWVWTFFLLLILTVIGRVAIAWPSTNTAIREAMAGTDLFFGPTFFVGVYIPVMLQSMALGVFLWWLHSRFAEHESKDTNVRARVLAMLEDAVTSRPAQGPSDTGVDAQYLQWTQDERQQVLMPLSDLHRELSRGSDAIPTIMIIPLVVAFLSIFLIPLGWIILFFLLLRYQTQSHYDREKRFWKEVIRVAGALGIQPPAETSMADHVMPLRHTPAYSVLNVFAVISGFISSLFFLPGVFFIVWVHIILKDTQVHLDGAAHHLGAPHGDRRRPVSERSLKRTPGFREAFILALFAGGVSGFVASITNTVYFFSSVVFLMVSPSLFILFVVSVIAPLVEESAKPFYLYLLKLEDRPMFTVGQWTMLGFAAGLGFALMEDVIYISRIIPGNGLDAGLRLLLLRLSFPVHMMGTALAGAGIGLWQRTNRVTHFTNLIVISMVIHGLYNATVSLVGMVSREVMTVATLVLLTICTVAVVTVRFFGSRIPEREKVPWEVYRTTGIIFAFMLIWTAVGWAGYYSSMEGLEPYLTEEEVENLGWAQMEAVGTILAVASTVLAGLLLLLVLPRNVRTAHEGAERDLDRGKWACAPEEHDRPDDELFFSFVDCTGRDYPCPFCAAKLSFTERTCITCRNPIPGVYQR